MAWLSTEIIASALERAIIGPTLRKHLATLPDVQFSDEGRLRHLHLDSIWIQGSMDKSEPSRLVHEYIQRMMAWLLFVPPDCVPQREAVQLGLGAGSLTRFCAQVLRMKTTAIELNPQVLHACRGWFKLPADSARLRVVLGDAAEEIQKPEWQGVLTALQVDLYDQQAAAPVYESPQFYAHCRAALREDGCMTVNLFGRSVNAQSSVDKIAAAFGPQAVWRFTATREGNTVLLAQRTASRPAPAELAARAQTIQTRWGLPATKWLRSLKTIVKL